MITLPAKLEELGDEAFAGCEGFYNQTVVAPASLTKVGKAAFAGAYINSIRTLDPEMREDIVNGSEDDIPIQEEG